MKKTLPAIVLALCLSCAFANEEYPPVHRGFFYSAGIGVSYINSFFKDITSTSNYYDEDDGHHYRKYYIEESGYHGIGAPSMDFKLGFSVLDLFSGFVMFDGTIYHGKAWDQEYEEYRQMTVDADPKEESKHSYAIAFNLGYGFNLYPFFLFNDSPFSGSYVGFAFSISGISAELGDSDLDPESINFKMEIGKDWQVNRSWSVGVGLAYQFAIKMLDYDNDAKNDFHNRIVSLLFHISHN